MGESGDHYHVQDGRMEDGGGGELGRGGDNHTMPEGRIGDGLCSIFALSNSLNIFVE
jgi:hypothetical protein